MIYVINDELYRSYVKSGANSVGDYMIDVYKNFRYNIEKAECLLDLLILKEFRDEVFDGVIEGGVDDVRIGLRQMFPALNNMPLLTAPIDGPIEIFRSTVKPVVDRHLDINAQTFQQQAVVIAVTALESYLRDRYILEKNKGKPDDEIEKEIADWKTPFQRPDIIKKLYEELGIDNVLSLTEQKEEIIRIMLIRHIIVHRAGEINIQFCDKFGISKRDWLEKNIQDYFEKNPNIVPRYIELIKKFVEQVEFKILT